VDQKPAGMSAHLGKRGVAKGFSLEAGRKRRRRAQHPVTDGLQNLRRGEWGQGSQMVKQHRPQRPASSGVVSLGWSSG